jgi:hypothetical protein
MKYPSCFVLLLAEKETELLHQHQNVTPSSISSNIPTTPSQSGIHNISLTSPTSPCALPGLSADSPAKATNTPISEYLFVPTLEPGLGPKESEAGGSRILQKAWQDATSTSGISVRSVLSLKWTDSFNHRQKAK